MWFALILNTRILNTNENEYSQMATNQVLSHVLCLSWFAMRWEEESLGSIMSEASSEVMPPLERLSEAEVNHFLRGFPEVAVSSAQELRTGCNDESLEGCLFGLLSFYLPSDVDAGAIQQKPEARLREDLGLDSLALSEAMFKIEELFDIFIDNAELVNVVTLADARRMLTEKLATRDE